METEEGTIGWTCKREGEGTKENAVTEINVSKCIRE
jgi:hypothetical protein